MAAVSLNFSCFKRTASFFFSSPKLGMEQLHICYSGSWLDDSLVLNPSCFRLPMFWSHVWNYQALPFSFVSDIFQWFLVNIRLIIMIITTASHYGFINNDIITTVQRLLLPQGALTLHHSSSHAACIRRGEAIKNSGSHPLFRPGRSWYNERSIKRPWWVHRKICRFQCR